MIKILEYHFYYFFVFKWEVVLKDQPRLACIFNMDIRSGRMVFWSLGFFLVHKFLILQWFINLKAIGVFFLYLQESLISYHSFGLQGLLNNCLSIFKITDFSIPLGIKKRLWIISKILNEEVVHKSSNRL